MSMDRAELAGTGAALAFHVALVAALSLSLAQIDSVPEPPSMEVEFVDEVGLTAAAPTRPAPAKAAPAKAAPAKPAPRVSRLGDDFLKGIDEAPAKSAGPAKAAAATFDANALASIQQAIRRQVQPCANRQVDPGPGANRIRVTLNVRLNRSGRLNGPPRVVRTTGVDEENSRYEERVKDLAVAAYTGCAPLTGLPPDLYKTAKGGWSNINMTYRLP